MNQPVEGVDARTDRVAQGAIGVALLAAFVFRVPLIVPLLAIILGISALAGPRANGLNVVFERGIAPRLPRPGGAVPEGRVAAPVARAQDALAAGALVGASSMFLLGVGFVGWVLVMGEAGIAIVAATTRLHVVELLRKP